MANQTGRVLIAQALKKPFGTQGWRARAVGWFTRELGGEWSAVLAVSAAVQGLPPGQCMATLHVSLRHAGVEREVAELCGLLDSYQQRTLITSVGYLMPQARWVEWLVTPESVEAVAQELADAVEAGLPSWFANFNGKADSLIAETGSAWLGLSAVELVRHLVVTRKFRGDAAAGGLVEEAEAVLSGGGQGLAAGDKQRALQRFKASLST